MFNKPKQIKETKCTCQACGNTWFYGKEDVRENKMNTMSNAGKGLACCGGCLPALLVPDKKVIDLGKCPKCNSKAIKKETVIYDI
jgi:predicted nucleic-acid-binding Zn-ribbon protein